MGRYIRASVSRVEADEFEAHGIRGHSGHDRKVAPAFFDRDHVAHGLDHFTEGESSERLFHCSDKRIPSQYCAYTRLVQVAHHSRLRSTFHRYLKSFCSRTPMRWPGVMMRTA